MDIFTHGLTGILLAENQGSKSRKVWVFWAVCAVAPDLDMLSGLAGPLAYYSYHRRILHGVAGALVLILLLSWLYRRFGLGSLRSGALIAGSAVTCHLFLDVATSFGTSLFYPFSDRDFSLDLLFMFDLWIMGIMLVPIILTFLIPSQRRTLARIAVLLVAVYIALAGYGKQQALASLEQVKGPGSLAARKGEVIPQPFSPWNWAGFVVQEDGIWAGRINLLSDQKPTFRFYAEVNDPLLDLADQVPAVHRFFATARFPYVKRETEGNRVIFIYSDLRFSFSGLERSNRHIGVEVEIGPDGTIHYQGRPRE
jgi:inner membrane protein